MSSEIIVVRNQNRCTEYALPELPEVETVVRSIAPRIIGKTILRAEFYSSRVTRNGLSQTAAILPGTIVRAVRRRGKQIFLDLDCGILYVHLGMTGKLLWNSTKNAYTRVVFQLDNGNLHYDDIRQFGRVEFYTAVPKALEGVGPDALEISPEKFRSRLRQRRVKIKSLLLDQSFVAGVGNIYADEILFAAQIHPNAIASKISTARAERLHLHLNEVLQQAVFHKGSSISDYVDGDGNRGSFQDRHRVYQRTDAPCPNCGTKIKRIIVAQRSTHYCPRCQRV